MNQTNIFDVVVIATMSAGKSTVINALIGHELLHSANEATTATITRIHDKDSLTSFEGMAYDFDDNVIDMEEAVDGELLRKWNTDPSIKTIDLAGNIKAIHNDHTEIVIYDTPGPNNSQDGSHAMLTMEVIDDGQFGLILYVLNATQLGINDDKELLEKIRKSLDQDMHKEIIFLLNKADCLDQDKGESIDKLVANAQNYLNNLGFANPTIICTAAQQALLAQKVLNGELLTRSQRNELKQALSFLDDTSILLGSKMEGEVKAKVLDQYIRYLGSVDTCEIMVSDGFAVQKNDLNRIIWSAGFGYVYQLLQSRLKQSECQAESAIAQDGEVSVQQDAFERNDKMSQERIEVLAALCVDDLVYATNLLAKMPVASRVVWLREIAQTIREIVVDGHITKKLNTIDSILDQNTHLEELNQSQMTDVFEAFDYIFDRTGKGIGLKITHGDYSGSVYKDSDTSKLKNQYNQYTVLRQSFAEVLQDQTNCIISKNGETSHRGVASMFDIYLMK